MPYGTSSEKQGRTMRAIAHGWKPKGKGLMAIPMSVAKEFVEEDMEKKAKGKRKKMIERLMDKGEED
jgi:hypothetical protein